MSLIGSRRKSIISAEYGVWQENYVIAQKVRAQAKYGNWKGNIQIAEKDKCSANTKEVEIRYGMGFKKLGGPWKYGK